MKDVEFPETRRYIKDFCVQLARARELQKELPELVSLAAGFMLEDWNLDQTDSSGVYLYSHEVSPVMELSKEIFSPNSEIEKRVAMREGLMA